jgi:tyrosinase
MRWPLFLTAVSAVSASILPRMSVNLPASAFPKFRTLSLEDAKAGKDLLERPGSNYTHPLEHEELKVATVQTAAAASCASNPNMRYEWRNYATTDRLAFIAAIKCLMGKPPSGNFPPATNRYEDLVRLHQKYMPNIHGNANFVIWHRYYLWTFEQVLRRECGFNRPFPWWDEAKDAGQFHNSDMFTDPNYFGHMTSYPNGDPVCIGSGAFSGLTCHIGPGQSNTPHCLSRAINGALTSQCNQGYVDTCNSRTNYNDMASCSELG